MDAGGEGDALYQGVGLTLDAAGGAVSSQACSGGPGVIPRTG